MDNRYRSRSFALSQLHPDNRGMFISVVFLGGVIIAFLLAYVAFGQDVDLAPTSLRLVAVVHRHGDRTPTKTYENDPYKDEEKYWPIGWGQLTLRGKQQLYKLGKTFRKLYKGFVPFFSVKTVRVLSSDVDRTLMSAAAFLAGMFPPKDDQKWTDELNWQPIPVHTVPKDIDTLIALKAPCPKYSSEKDKVLAEIKGNETIVDKELYEYITENAGQKVESVREIETLYSCFFIEELNGYQLPEWTKKVYPQPMKEKTQMSFATFAWNTIMKRLHGGPFVNELLQTFQDKLTGKLKDKKLFLYSGHDITIVTLWRTFGFEEHIVPSFGAALIWELHEFPDRNYYVKMFYMNNTDLNEPYTLRIPKCSDPCPLEEFSEALKDVRPIDWQHECQLDNKPPKLNAKLK